MTRVRVPSAARDFCFVSRVEVSVQTLSLTLSIQPLRAVVCIISVRMLKIPNTGIVGTHGNTAHIINLFTAKFAVPSAGK